MTNIKYIDDYIITKEDLELSDWNNYDFIRNAIIDKMAVVSPSGYEWIIGTANHEYKITTEAEDFEEGLEAFKVYIDGEFFGDGFSIEGVARITERPEA
jgi:hypothetical protein